MAWEWERTLYWLASANRKSTRKDPMNIDYMAKTVDEYASFRQKFICFCLPAMDENEKVVGFKFTEKRREEFELLRGMYVLDGESISIVIKHRYSISTDNS